MFFVSEDAFLQRSISPSLSEAIIIIIIIIIMFQLSLEQVLPNK